MKVFHAQGEFTLATAVAQRATLPALQAGEQLEINLSQLSAADSAAVAVLLDWLRSARQQRAEIYFTELPAGLAGLIRLYDVSSLLPIK